MNTVDLDSVADARSRPKGVLRHRARQQIEQLITTGEVAPGAKLVQEDLATRLGVTRTVVREALFELRGMGLVEAIDNRGVVARFDTKRLLESFDLREALEGMVARLCCEHMSRAVMNELRELAHRIHTLHTAGRHDEGAAADQTLHQRLLEVAGNSVLREQVERSWVCRKFFRTAGSDDDATLQSHLKMLDAIASGDADAAERAARDHVRQGKRTFEKQIEDGTLRPVWVR